jgi:starch synthase
MKLMFVSSELAPLCQSGGLGDAVSGLARALGAHGHHVEVVVPGYRSALRSPFCPRLTDQGPLRVGFRADDDTRFELNGRVLSAPLFPGVTVTLLDMPLLYDRPGLYGDHGGSYGDNGLRFLTLARAAAYRAESHVPDVVVAHDWHAAPVLAILKTSLHRGRCRGIGLVQVIHNNAHQGRLPASCMALTGLAADLFHPDGVESWGELNSLKCGVAYADRIVAVSPRYAQEIQTADFGEGLEGLYQSRAHRLRGIENGIDVERYDPSTDAALQARYSSVALDGKDECRRQTLQELGLQAPERGRFVVAVGRLAGQKGWDVLEASVDELVDRGASVALLGDGDRHLVSLLQSKARAHPGRVWFRAAFDEGMSRRLYAAADVVLVPSRFEPCGLVQLIAQRYGALPVAHATGGLVDTICDPAASTMRTSTADPWDTATGVLFSPLQPNTLVDAVERVFSLGASGRWREVQARLMNLDVSWTQPARAWRGVLEEAAREGQGRL